MSDIKLTELTGPCDDRASKIGPDTLAQVLYGLPAFYDGRLLVGYDTPDDAAVYQLIPELALIQIMNIFPPAVDDVHEYGRIAAANSLSDIWAMGGEVRLCMNILMLPEHLPSDAVQTILRGGYDKAAEVEAIVAGGHAIKDDTPKYDLCASGMVHPDRILRNNSIQEGDVLILTKSLDTGVLTNADRGGLLSDVKHRAMADCMATLNKYAADAVHSLDGVHTRIDVTGFSLLGHSYEICGESGLTVIVDNNRIPLLLDADSYVSMGLVPAVVYQNMKHPKDKVVLPKDLSSHAHDLLLDPQTSGGLLYSVISQEVGRIMEALQKACQTSAVIGHVEGPSSHLVMVI